MSWLTKIEQLYSKLMKNFVSKMVVFCNSMKQAMTFIPLSVQHQQGGTNVKVCAGKIFRREIFPVSNPKGLTLTFVETCDIFAAAV